MRVALYVHCFFPTHFYGTEAYTLTLAKELAALGHEPIVVSTTLVGEPAQTKLVEEYTYEGIPVLSIDKNVYPDRSVRDTYVMSCPRTYSAQASARRSSCLPSDQSYDRST
jgi:hypothetical protein